MEEEYNDRCIVYTDVSKSSEGGVGAAAAWEDGEAKVALPGVASIFTTEMQAIKLALKHIHDGNRQRYLACLDSLSSLKAIQCQSSRNHLVQRIQEEICRIIATLKTITFFWIPGHSGIKGNDQADRVAKQAARQPPQFITVP